MTLRSERDMETLRQLQEYLMPLARDLVALCIWLLLLMVFFIPLERLGAQRPQKTFRKAFLTDLGYYFINSLVPKLFLIVPMSMFAVALHYSVPSGWYLSVAGMPIWVRFGAAIMVGEFGTYWGHRWMHEIPILWRFHAIHHSAEEMDWLVNTRAHPLDMVFSRLCGLIPMYVLGLAQPTGSTVDVVPLVYALFGTAWGFFIHANVRWRFGWLERVVSTPGFHHWHHTKDGSRDRNYAAILPVLDRIFGTHHLPVLHWPTEYGIAAPMAPGLVGQLMQPLRGGRTTDTTI
jgi:sterol desaturase/sphingolipid hydroxylase (fatty acid hydroxylase superfamily)